MSKPAYPHEIKIHVRSSVYRQRIISLDQHLKTSGGEDERPKLL